MTTAKSKRFSRTPFIIAIIGAIATIIGGILAGPLILRLLPSSTAQAGQVAVRVADDTGASVSRVKTLLFFQEGPLSQFTDANGVANFKFNLPEAESVAARLVVESDQYEIFEQGIQLPRDKVVDVRLKKRTGNEASVIFRVVDDANSLSISGAKILLLVQGNVLSETTDSNGISKFALSFPASGQLDVQISVNTKNYDITDQRVTLTPNKVQDIRLNPLTSTLTVSDVTPLTKTQQADVSSETASFNQPSNSTDLDKSSDANISKKGVVAKAITSDLVDRETGFRVTTEPSQTAKDKAEVRVIIASPDNQPFVGTYVAIHKQKTDVNNQPVQGDRVAEFRTDNTGSAETTIEPGTYGIWPDIAGYSWKQLNFNQKLEAGKRTIITIVPSRLIIVVRLADKTLVPNSYISVSTQKQDVNGNPLLNQRVGEARVRDTGEVQFDLVPGSYMLYIEVARGEDWGTFDNILPPATQITYSMNLGRIRIEARDDKGNVAGGFYSAAFFQRKDANNKNIPGDRISECRTDNTGVCNLDLTPGTYVVQTDAGIKYDIVVKSGETISLKNTDFVKP